MREDGGWAQHTDDSYLHHHCHMQHHAHQVDQKMLYKKTRTPTEADHENMAQPMHQIPVPRAQPAVPIFKQSYRPAIMAAEPDEDDQMQRT